MDERQTIDRGWYYVVEPDDGRHAPESRRIVADDGAVLTRRLHGQPGRIEVVDESGAELPVATWLRAQAALGAVLEDRGWLHREVVLRLGPVGTPAGVGVAADGRAELRLDGPWVAAQPLHHPVEALVDRLVGEALPGGSAQAPDPAGLPEAPVPRALFFESLMNTDMPHNDKEISQGVLHMISPLKGLETEVVLVNAKMPIEGDLRPVHGLERLEAAPPHGSDPPRRDHAPRGLLGRRPEAHRHRAGDGLSRPHRRRRRDALARTGARGRPPARRELHLPRGRRGLRAAPGRAGGHVHRRRPVHRGPAPRLPPHRRHDHRRPGRRAPPRRELRPHGQGG